jgi:hypothetical protein
MYSPLRILTYSGILAWLIGLAHSTDRVDPLQWVPLYVSVGPSATLPNLDTGLSDIAARNALEVWILRTTDNTVDILLKRITLLRDGTPEILVDARGVGAWPASDPMLGPGAFITVSCRTDPTISLRPKEMYGVRGSKCGPSELLTVGICEDTAVSIKSMESPGIMLDLCGQQNLFNFPGSAKKWAEDWATAQAERSCPPGRKCSFFLRACEEKNPLIAVHSVDGPIDSFQVVGSDGLVTADLYRSQRCAGLYLPGLFPVQVSPGPSVPQ